MDLSDAPLSPTAAPRRVFWDWSRPLLEWAVEELTKGWEEGTLDLSSSAVVVPTGEAGRRLLGALVMRAASRGAAVVSPRILLPDGVLDWALEEGWSAADAAASSLSWVEVFQEMKAGDFPTLFPMDPNNEDFSWALNMASTLQGLQETLGEAGWSIGDATKWLGEEFEEAERWRELTILEKRYETVLGRRGLRDRNRVRSQQVRRMQVPEGLRKIYLFAVPDPLPLAVTAMNLLTQQPGIEIVVCIHAPILLGDAFDAWGRPVVEFWSTWEIPVPSPESTLRAFASPMAQAAEITRICAEVEDPAAQFVVGIMDEEVVPHTLSSMAEEGLDCYHPQGVAFRQHPLRWVLCVWQDLLASRSWGATCQLARIPEILHLLESFSQSPDGELLPALDAFLEQHLPATIDEALKLAGPKEVRVRRALEGICGWLDRFDEQPIADALTAWLEEIRAEAFCDENDGEIFMERLGWLVAAVERFPQRLNAAQCLQLLLHLVEDAPLFPQASATGILLSGWLELAWQQADGLILAGCNEGGFPSSITSDPWLPHGLRGRLKLKTNEARLARDAYLFSALLASREGSPGKIHCLFGQASTNGDPLKPSRLLMQCAPEELAARVQHLFAELPSSGTMIAAPWKRAWRLRPTFPEDWHPVHVTSTGFQKFLLCPFRYYLSTVLRMNESDPLKQELSALDFGNLCHNALEKLAKNPEMNLSTDESTVREFLRSEVSDAMRKVYGTALSLPLRIQLHSLQQRLGAAAKVLVQNREDGWEVKFVEIDFEKILGAPWIREGLEIRGRIDRVEYHPVRKCWRVIDFKTSARPVAPFEAHVKTGQPGSHLAFLGDAVTVPDQAKVSVWKNLQLPLYAAVLAKHYDQPVEAAYFNLPPALMQTGLVSWPDLSTSGLIDSALRCADAVIHAIQKARFWPPNPKPEFDDYARIFIRGVADSIDPAALIEAMALRA